MKAAFALCGLIFVLMYIAAQVTLDRPKADRIVRMRWATDANPARNVQTALFGKLYPGLQVSVDPGPAGDPSKLIVQCATGTGPDLIDVYGLEQMQSFVGAGILLDLTPDAKSMGFDPSRTYPSLKDGLEVDGRQYRFPCNVNANCVIYDKEIFDDHVVPYPR